MKLLSSVLIWAGTIKINLLRLFVTRGNKNLWTANITALMLFVAVAYLFAPLPLSVSGLGVLSHLVRQNIFRVPLPILWVISLMVAAYIVTQLHQRRTQSFVYICAACITLYCETGIIDIRGVAEIICWLFFFTVASISLHDSNRIFVFWVLLNGSQMIVAIVLYWLPGHEFITRGFGIRAQGLFESVNLLYTLALMTFFAAGQSAFWHKEQAWRNFYAIVAAVSFATVILTFSRGAWIGIAIGLGATFVLHRRTRSIAAYSTVALLLIGALLIRTHGSVVSSSNDGSAASRFIVWRQAKKLVLQRPFFGYGYQDYQDLPWVNTGLLEPKNLLLNLTLQHGLIGLFLYTAFFAACVRSAFQLDGHPKASEEDRIIAGTVFACIIGVLAAGMFDTPVFGGVERLPATVTLLMFIGMLEGRCRIYTIRALA